MSVEGLTFGREEGDRDCALPQRAGRARPAAIPSRGGSGVCHKHFILLVERPCDLAGTVSISIKSLVELMSEGRLRPRKSTVQATVPNIQFSLLFSARFCLDIKLRRPILYTSFRGRLLPKPFFHTVWDL